MASIPTRSLALAALFAALIAAGAFVTIPLGPVPFTMQVFFVLLAGMVLGPRLGVLAVATYLCLGLVAPVYAGATSGLGVLLGPTGGYLWGFLPGVLVTAAIAGNGRPAVSRFIVAGLAGLVPVYAMGAAWLAWQLHTTSYAIVIWGGILQFAWLDAVKAVLAAFAARALVSLPVSLPALQRHQ